MGGYGDEFPLLSALGLYAADIRGDGNCLFNALSDQLYGQQNEHHTIRSRVIDYMREHAEYYKQFLDVYPGGGTRRNPKRKTTGAYSSPISLSRPSPEDVDRVFEQHLQTMARGGTWGDNMEIQAFSSAFEVDVKIYQRDFAYMIQASESSAIRPVAHIAYHTWEHYSSIRNLDGPHTGMPHVQLKALSLEEESQQRQKLAESSPVQPWMINSLQGSFPYLLDRGLARKILEECKGSVDQAYEKLLETEDGGSASSAQESSSIEREVDSEDDVLNGPNKRRDRRMSRATRHKITPHHSRLAPLHPPSDHGSQESVDSAYSDGSSAAASRSGTQDTTVTDPDTVIAATDTDEKAKEEPPKRPIRIKLHPPKPPSAETSPEKTRQRPPGPRRVTARDRKDMKKQAQKAARKERQQASAKGGGGVTAEAMKTGMALRSKGMTATPPIETGFRTLFI